MDYNTRQSSFIKNINIGKSEASFIIEYNGSDRYIYINLNIIEKTCYPLTYAYYTYISKNIKIMLIKNKLYMLYTHTHAILFVWNLEKIFNTCEKISYIKLFYEQHSINKLYKKSNNDLSIIDYTPYSQIIVNNLYYLDDNNIDYVIDNITCYTTTPDYIIYTHINLSICKNHIYSDYTCGDIHPYSILIYDITNTKIQFECICNTKKPTALCLFDDIIYIGTCDGVLHICNYTISNEIITISEIIQHAVIISIHANEYCIVICFNNGMIYSIKNNYSVNEINLNIEIIEKYVRIDNTICKHIKIINDSFTFINNGFSFVNTLFAYDDTLSYFENKTYGPYMASHAWAMLVSFVIFIKAKKITLVIAHNIIFNLFKNHLLEYDYLVNILFQN